MIRLGISACVLCLFFLSNAFAWDIVKSFDVDNGTPYSYYANTSINYTNLYHIQIHGDPGATVQVRIKRNSDSVILFDEVVVTTLQLIVLDDFMVDEDCFCQFDLSLLDPGQGQVIIHADLMKESQ